MRKNFAMAATALLMIIPGGAASAAPGLCSQQTGSASGCVPSGAVVLAGPGSLYTTYTTPAATVTVGGELDLVSGDIQNHDVVADAHGADTAPWCGRFTTGACPLFWSALVTGTTRVLGTDQLQPGVTYTFYCSIHRGMHGTLVTLP